MNDAAEVVLPQIRLWKEQLWDTKIHTLNSVAQTIMHLRTWSIFSILHAPRLHIVIYFKEPEPNNLTEIESLLAPTMSFISCILNLVEGREPGRELSCFKVQYEWAIRSVVEVLTFGRRQGWDDLVSKLENLYQRVLENRCDDLSIAISGISLLTSLRKNTIAS